MMMNRNFALKRVKSINTSGHKFGLVYAGKNVKNIDPELLPSDSQISRRWLDYLAGREIPPQAFDFRTALL